MIKCHSCNQSIAEGYKSEHSARVYCQTHVPESWKSTILEYDIEDDFENCPIYYTDQLGYEE